ncbi:MAG: helix-turn-helix domain-containing protein [Aliarcobacter sp.]|jgi:excisionase family DNA binding protein|nr:helix-turn-helix domain-containing protein [Aliarcobacter sp.]
MNNEIKRKYRAKELAEYLSVGLSTIWKWAKDGKIRPHNISKGVTVFDINEVLIDLGMEIN